MSLPSISVVLALYNGEKFIGSQLSSITQLLSERDELIIVDDASSDSSLKIVAESAPQATVISLPTNVGHVRAFERGLKAAMCDVVVLCDQDDVWLSNRLSLVREHFNANDGLTMLFVDPIAVSEALEPLEDGLFQYSRPRGGGLIAVVRMISNRASPIGCMMAFRRSLLEIALPIPNRVSAHDQWLYGVACLSGCVQSVPLPAVLYRRHDRVLSRRRRRMWPKIADRLFLVLHLLVRWIGSWVVTCAYRDRCARWRYR